MSIIYNIKIERNLLTDKQADEITKYYPVGEAVYIPCIKDKFRNEPDILEQALFNDKLIFEILEYIEKTKYLGTYYYTANFYSDYFDGDEEFINILYSEEIKDLIIEAIFISNKQKDS